MLTQGIEFLPPGQIVVPRDDRQRRTIEVDDLLPSIQRLGILNPIIVNADCMLIAGERRLAAAIKLNLPLVPVRRAESLTDIDAQLIELDENLRREELPWQDRVIAMARMLEIFRAESPEATITAFSDFIGYQEQWVYKCLTAAKEITKGNERVIQAPSMAKAMNVVVRENERLTNNALADIIDTLAEESQTAAPPIQSDEEDGALPIAPAPAPDPESIVVANFHEWARTYSGQKFNLVHCDFPYGVNLQDSDQAGQASRQMYEDGEAVYWSLLQTLADYQERFLSSSSHIVFWFSMQFYRETLHFFETQMSDWTLEPFPLIWHKTDNKGIAPDVERRPRRVYETALFGWRGDRKLVKLGSNAYGAPKANSNHVSEKPEPVLRQFLSMVCDSHTRLLDPTCGSGSALRAAESLGATRVLGLELDPEFAADARAKLKSFRALRKLSNGGK